MSATNHTVDPKFTYYDKRARKQVVLYQGLLDAAHRAGLSDIMTDILQYPSADNNQTCIVQATVRFYHGDSGTRFMGIGDANPQNVGANIAPHFIRMAETRAKARALRDALNVGMVSIEELGPDYVPDHDDDGHAAAQPTPTPRPQTARDMRAASVASLSASPSDLRPAAPSGGGPPPAPTPLTEDQEKVIAQAWDMAESGDTYMATRALVETLQQAATDAEWTEIRRRWFSVRQEHYPSTIPAKAEAQAS